MGLPPSRLPWVCFLLGLFGAVTMTIFQYWASAVSWPINVGGKPWNSLAGVRAGHFRDHGALRRRRHRPLLLLVGRAAGPDCSRRCPTCASPTIASRWCSRRPAPAFNRSAVEALLKRFHPVTIEERGDVGLMRQRALTIGLAVLLVASIGLNIAVRRGAVTSPPFEYFPDMARTVRYNAFEANPNFADGMTLRVPPPGTIPRGLLPLASEALTPPGTTPENPFKADDARRGRTRARSCSIPICVPCHGATARGRRSRRPARLPGASDAVCARGPAR